MHSRILVSVLLLLILHSEICAEQPVISEFQTLNKRTLVSKDGEAYGWIEIQNLATDPDAWSLRESLHASGSGGSPGVIDRP